VEELETSNEELQATNEELLSSNEELQSTNEELQSVNEELHTVNAELMTKNTELVNLGADLDTLLVTSEVAILLLDENLAVRQFTPSVTRIFSVTVADIGKSVSYVRHTLMCDDLMGSLEQVSTSGRELMRDVTDNNRNTFILRISPYRAKSAARSGVVVSLTNINERVRSEAVLRESEERTRLMVDALQGFAIHLLDPKGYVVSWNDSAEGTTGFSRRDVLGRKLETLFDPAQADAGGCDRLLAAALETGKAEDNGWRRRKDGSSYWANDVVSPLLDTGGELKGFVRISRDQSARREAELQLLKLSQAVEQSRERIIVADAEGRIEYVNTAFLDSCGRDKAAVLGRGLFDELRERISDTERDALAAAIQGRNPWQGDIHQPGPDGKGLILRSTLTPLRQDDGQVTNLLLMQEDVTDTVELTKTLMEQARELELRVQERTAELTKARLLAEQSAQAKSDFLANMSHEIRTPMNAVLGLAYRLERMGLPPEGTALAHKIHSAGYQLLGILNDILDFSKIEAGRLEVEREPFDLGEVLDNLATIMAASAAGKKLELSIVPPPPRARRLVGDALRIGQVLINLTSNAIKFTDSGLVEVKIAIESERQDRFELRFSVCDTGIGMDAETQSRLFAPFAQADASTTRRFGGTGLGLAISRRLVELMGGTLDLTSAPGEGSTFAFVLELARQDHDHLPAGSPRGLKVLVAEDNPVVLEGFEATIRSIGWTPELHPGGEAVLARVLDDPGLQTHRTVLLLDWRLPDLDGLEVARSIGDRLPKGSRPIVLLITAHGTEQLDMDQASGLVDAVLSKPLGPSMLYNAVAQARARRLGEPAPIDPHRQARRRLEGLRMLVVDDSTLNRDVAQELFGYEGAQVHLAEDGQQAIGWLREHLGSVDIVLMDVHMPGIDGHETTKRIRAVPELAGLPIAALTADALAKQQDAALTAGMNGFIAKPFVVDEAVGLILSLTGREAGAGVVHPGPGAQPEAPEAATGGPPILNSERGLKLFRRRDTYERILHVFSEDYRPHLGLLADPASTLESIQALAHKLRGAAGNLGLERVAASATAVETRIRAGEEVREERRRLAEDLEQAIAAVGEFLTPEADEPVGDPMPAADPERIAPLLQAAMAALGKLNPDPMEPVLADLSRQLPPARLREIGQAVERFDFVAAEEAVRRLAAELEIALDAS